MTASPVDRSHLLPYLPEDRVGSVVAIEPIRQGLSGAGVYAVTTSRGAYILRFQERGLGPDDFTQQIRVLRRAVEAGIAPPVVHVDEGARAVVSVRVAGVPMAAALADSSQREAVLASVVARLRSLHALDPSMVAERDPLPRARAAWGAARQRSGIPPWAVSLEPTFDALAITLATDARRVVSHNDVNPGNVLWDGTQAWLVDWEVTGLTHPYFDLATLALFLRLDDHVALELVAGHDGAPPGDAAKATFRALRKLAGLLCGFTFLELVGDLRVLAAPTLAEAPSLGDCYAGMRAGKLDLRTPLGSASMGLALLRESLAPL